MDHADGAGALADGRRDALARVGAHVARGEDAGDTGLEQVRVPLERPAARDSVRTGKIRTGQDVPLLVELQQARDHFRPGPGTDEDEGRCGDKLSLLCVVHAADDHLLEPARAADRGDLDPRQDFDVRRGRDPVDQVLRHRLAEGFPPDEQGDVPRVTREKEGALRRRVPGPDDAYVLAPVGRGLGHRGTVVDADTEEGLDSGNLQRPDGYPRGQDDRVARNVRPVREPNDAIGILAAKSHHLLSKHLGAEAAGLREGAAREVGSTDAGRKPEVVLDLGAGAGLAAGRVVLDEQGAQPLRSAVDRRGQPRGTRADDHEIVEGQARPRLHADLFGQLAVRRGDEIAAVGEEEDRQLRRVAERADQLPRRRVLVDVDPLIGDLIAGQELLHGVAPRRRLRAGDPDAFVGKAHVRRPVGQQVVEDRVEPLSRRIPGLQQVVVQPDIVDSGDRGLRVGIGGEQDPFRVRVELEHFAQQLGAGHPGHPFVHEEEGDRSASLLELPGGLERLAARAGLEDAVIAPVVAAKVALDRAEHLGVVVDGQDHRFGHVSPFLRRSAASR